MDLTGTRGKIQENVGQHSITACLRCRDQKLRCARERPICTRCQRRNATCVYPSPPDRRGPRAQRTPHRAHRAIERCREQTRSRRSVTRRLRDESMSPNVSAVGTQAPIPGSVPGLQHSSPIDQNDYYDISVSPRGDAQTGDGGTDSTARTPVLSHSYATQLSKMSSVATEIASDSNQPALPPTALGLSLLEIYFARIYNASVLFYKPVLFQQYLEDRLHGALLKAIFALATLFLNPRDEGHQHDANQHAELRVLSAYHSCGFPWAKSAMREAMSLVIEAPCLMIVQALECVQLYWFGVGKPQPGNLCLALAYRSCHLLGYSKKITDECDSSVVSLESELGRRCFWACWTSTCIVMEPEPYIRFAWQEVAMVPLPGCISSTPSGCEVILHEKMDEAWFPSSLKSRNGSNPPLVSAACLMKMVGVWAKVQLLCRDYVSSSTARGLDAAQNLSRLAKSIFGATMSIRDSACGSDTSHGTQPLLLVHDVLYHQCQITLHSLFVPLFSGMSADPTIDPQTRRTSAKTVVCHADLFEGLLRPYIYGRGDITCLPPLVGYGAFITGIVFLATEISCRDREMHGAATESGKKGCRMAAVNAILHLLDTLRIHWRPLQNPWETLQTASRANFSQYRKQTQPAESRGMGIDSQQPGQRVISEQQIDLLNDQPPPLMTEQRESGVLGSSQHRSPDVTEPSDSIAAQFDIFQDYDWYSLSFAETGVEQFAGLEPSTLLQQGWSTFS